MVYELKVSDEDSSTIIFLPVSPNGDIVAWVKSTYVDGEYSYENNFSNPDFTKTTHPYLPPYVWFNDDKWISMYGIEKNLATVYLVSSDGSNVHIGFFEGINLSYVRSVSSVSPDGRYAIVPYGLNFLFFDSKNERADVLDNVCVQDFPVSWHPSGTKFAYTDLDLEICDRLNLYLSTPKIYVMDLSTNTNRMVVEGENPTWSPTGNQIAFMRDNSLYVINEDGTGEKELLHSNNGFSDLLWSPSGQNIAFVFHGTYLKEHQAGIINVESGEYSILEGGITGRYDRIVSWSPDGKWFMIENDDDHPVFPQGIIWKTYYCNDTNCTIIEPSSGWTWCRSYWLGPYSDIGDQDKGNP